MLKLYSSCELLRELWSSCNITPIPSIFLMVKFVCLPVFGCRGRRGGRERERGREGGREEESLGVKQIYLGEKHHVCTVSNLPAGDYRELKKAYRVVLFSKGEKCGLC